jgi:hypothetical protein
MQATKISIAATALILVIGGTTAVIRHRRFEHISREKHKLVEQAKDLGIPLPEEDQPATKKRPHIEANSQAAAVAGQMVAFAKELELREKSGDATDEDFEKRGLEIQARLLELGPTQIRAVIGVLGEANQLGEETRQSMICMVISMLGETKPAEALAIYAESAALLDGCATGSAVISSTLETWAKQDPLAALEWIRKNAELHPEMTDDDAKRDLVAGAAQKDPQLAFRLLGEIGVEDREVAIHAIVGTAKTPAKRTAVLDALRAYLPKLAEDDRGGVLRDSLEVMGAEIAGEPFESVEAWMSEAKLTADERTGFASGLSYYNTKGDTGRWIDWMTANLPPEQLPENVGNLIGQWTQTDYQAAGKWLSQAPDGPAKSAAVSTYAAVVAEYDPQTAVQWALTLPEGSGRDDTMEAIYQNWPKKDAAAAQEFAKKHGIQTEPDTEPSAPSEEP